MLGLEEAMLDIWEKIAILATNTTNPQPMAPINDGEIGTAHTY